MSSLNSQYLKERDQICQYLRSKRLLKNVSILSQPPLLGYVLGEVMKVNDVQMISGASEEDQLNYILSWWGEVKAKRRQERK